jgi:glyoxylase-like metal-dependent hydrolase (beta-lactamase superfamily II)
MREQASQAWHIVDAAPAPVAAEISFPGSDVAGWQAVALSGLNAVFEFAPNLGCFLVRHRGRTVLCDAGIGPAPNIYLGGLRGDLLQRLATLGVVPEQIDLVVFTHLHMDHIGWASQPAAGEGRSATFPNADYVVGQAELDFWGSSDGSVGAHHRDAYGQIFHPLVAAGRVTGVAPDTEIIPGVRLLEMPGHTPGHCAIRFGDAHPLVIAGDVFHCPGQVERPDWCHRADMDAAARRTRRNFLDRAAAERWLIGAGHFRDGLSFGRIVAEGAGYRFLPQDDGFTTTG